MSYDKAYEVMKDIWYNQFVEGERSWFKLRDHIELHSTMGQYIRNEAHLWDTEWQPLIIDGVDHSHDHPEAISARVIKQFQENVKLGIEK